MGYFLEQTGNALSLGGIYALLALGLAMVFSILGLINFAHGELMTMTGYVLVFARLAGLPFLVAAPLAIAVAWSRAVLPGADRLPAGARRQRHHPAAHQLRRRVLLQVVFQNFISARPRRAAARVPDGDPRLGGFTIGVNR